MKLSLSLCSLIYKEESLQYNKNEEVAPFVKLSTIRKYYCCHCLGQLNAEFVTANATRLKESILHLNQNLGATTFKNEVYISNKDDLAVALHYSREHSIKSEAAHLSRAAIYPEVTCSSKNRILTGTLCNNASRNQFQVCCYHLYTC